MTENIHEDFERNAESAIDPETGWNLKMVRQMAESIMLAHDINPRSWCIHSSNGDPIPAVGFVNMGSVGPATPMGLMVDITNATDDQTHIISTFYKGRHLPARPWYRYLQFPADQVEYVLEACKNIHLDAVRRSAEEVQSNANRWRWHRADFVDEISRITGIPMPEPGYQNELIAPVSEYTKNRRYWKISPGKNASEWTRFLQKNAIAIHWSDTQYDLAQLSVSRDEFRRGAREALDVSPLGASSLWTFVHEMQPDDLVLGYGDKTVLGFGRITGDYVQVIDDFPYQHRRPVHWLSEEPRSIEHLPPEIQSKLMRLSTLVELAREEFEAATSDPGYEVRRNVDTSSAQTLRDRFAIQGLTYSNDQIATFYTALQTKGFVVLSGISGTGKSKIAQHFVQMLPSPSTATEPVTVDRDSVIELSIKPYIRRYRRVVIPIGQIGTLPPMNPGAQVVVPLRFEGITGTGRLVAQHHQDGNTVTFLYFRGQIADRIKALELDTPLILVPEARHDDEGIDAIDIYTDASQLPSEVTSHPSTPHRNSLFLSVRPDWRDSTSLLGYYNPLTETYEWTEFLRFLLRAVESHRQRDGLAWFVILDEMNLAHVEYYFADLLSIIESGRDAEGWSQEPIRLTYPDGKTDNPPPHEIHLPPNLYIIGTVNMDETTHAFSPKVLDRAFTIELTEVDFTNYPPEAAGSMELTDEEKQALLNSFTRNHAFAQINKSEIASVVREHSEIREWLQTLNAELSRYQFQFGYRVFDEIAQFVHNAEQNGMFDDLVPDVEAWVTAFDHAVLMKVLPKFNGSHARLSGPLSALVDWAAQPESPAWGDTARLRQEAANGSADTATPRLPRLHARASRMLDLLETNGFVSFG